MLRNAAMLSLFLCVFVSTADAEDTVLPDPPRDVSALALAEYQRAEQAYNQRQYAAAEAALERSWRLQKHPLTFFNLSLVHLKQDRPQTAVGDLVTYFALAPPGGLDANNAAAKNRLKRARTALGDRPEIHKLAEDTVTELRKGNYHIVARLDRGLYETGDLSLLYWIVLGEFRNAQANTGPTHRFKKFSPIFLDNLRHLLQAYFSGSNDLSETLAAQKLFDEITIAYERVKS